MMPTRPAPDGAISYVADERTAGRLSRALLRYRFSRPVSWINLLVLVGVTIGVGFAVGEPWMGPYLMVVLLPAVFISSYVSVARQLRGPFGAATTHWTLFGEGSMTIAGPLGVTESPYGTFQQAWTGGGAVVLRIRGFRAVHLLPAELVPAPQLDRLLSGVDGLERR
jgi:hypothetical protein